MGPSKSKKRGRTKRLSTVNPNAGGIDVGSQFHVVAVPADRDEAPVRTFQSFTGDLHRLADWLVACRIDTVAMESTGIYWVPLYEILQARGIAIVVANARDVKHVPGRKTDVSDAEWIAELLLHGSRRASCPLGNCASSATLPAPAPLWCRTRAVSTTAFKGSSRTPTSRTRPGEP